MGVVYATFEDVTDMAPDLPQTQEEQIRVEGLIRRAERSLTALLLGPAGTLDGLAQFDKSAVVDTIVDAVLMRSAAPYGVESKSETDGDYSYSDKYIRGDDDFLWPANWRSIFGIVAPVVKRVGTIPVGLTCAWRGWA